MINSRSFTITVDPIEEEYVVRRLDPQIQGM
jgi:hypothetical protein